jgi:tetratricopeptide (TPR) repeat protein
MSEVAILAEPIIVGREKELEQLHYFSELASQRQGKTVLISAEAGIGKTRLLREFMNSEKRNKNTVLLYGWCLFNAGVPYFPFIEAFSSYYSDLEEKGEKESEIDLWLKDPTKAKLSGQLRYLSPQALKDQTFAAVAKTIHSIATKKQVILVLEDIHWADSASLALLHYISRAIKDCERVIVLATFRSEALTCDSQGYPHQLIETLSMMRREDLFSEIKLLGLDQTTISKMAKNMLGEKLEPTLEEKLAIKSEGNPLFVVESLRMLHSQGNLVLKNDKWHLADGDLAIPRKIRDVIIQRLSCLKNDQRRILDAASVIGDEFRVGLLSSLLEQDSLEILETLNIIAHATSLVCADEDKFRFDHSSSREIIYEALAKPLRLGYHGRIAEINDRSKNTVLPIAELAYHYAKAGNKKKAVKYSLASATDELSKWSNLQAIEHFQYVVQTAENIEDKTIALEGLGDAYAANSMYTEAIKVFNELAASVTNALKLRVLRKASDASFHTWDPELLIEYTKKAEDLASYDRLEMARIICNRGRAWNSSGKNVKHGADYADFKAGLDVFEEENSLTDVGEALWRCGITGKQGGELEDNKLSMHLRSVAIFKELGDMRKEAEATLYLGFHFFSVGLFPEARNALFSVFQTGKRLGLFAEMTMACHWMCMINEIEGNIEAAIADCLRAQEFEKQTDARWVKEFPNSFARIYAKSGNIEKADEYFEKTIKSFPEDFAFTNPFFFVHISLGVYYAAKGLWDKSNRAFEKYEKSLREGFGEPEHELHYRLCYSWALQRQNRFQEAKIQLGIAEEVKKQLEEHFTHANVQMNLLTPRKVQTKEEFEVRLYIVNLARAHSRLIKVGGLVPNGIKVVSMPSFCSLKNNLIEIQPNDIDAFEVKSIILKMEFDSPGAYNFQPCLFFMTDQNETKTSEAKSITITVEPSTSKGKSDRNIKSIHHQFESELTRKAFDFLISAFRDDYYTRKLAPEECGWRTLMEVVRNGRVSMNSMYGRSGRGGKVKLEMIRAGLIEARSFQGERGRGGNILRIRIRPQNAKAGLFDKKQAK